MRIRTGPGVGIPVVFLSPGVLNAAGSPTSTSSAGIALPSDPVTPTRSRLRTICLALPGADMKVSHGRPAFFTKKIFAGHGAVLKGEHHSSQYDNALVFMPDAHERAAIDQDERFFVPAYWGPYGWRGLEGAQLLREHRGPSAPPMTVATTHPVVRR